MRKRYFDLQAGQWVHDYQGIFHILAITEDRIHFDWYDHSGELISRNTSLATTTMRKHEDTYGLRLATELESDLCQRRGAATEEQTLARLLKEAISSLLGRQLADPDLHDLLRHLEERGDSRASCVREVQGRLHEGRHAYQQILGKAFRDLVALAPDALGKELGLPLVGGPGFSEPF